MTRKSKVQKIIVSLPEGCEIVNGELVLPISAAKDLHESLDEFLGKEVRVVTQNVGKYYPLPLPSFPPPIARFADESNPKFVNPAVRLDARPNQLPAIWSQNPYEEACLNSRATRLSDVIPEDPILTAQS
jgi:hypothetical protein